VEEILRQTQMGVTWVDRTPRDSMRNTGTMGNEMMTMGTVGNEITSRREFDSAVHTGNRLIVPEEDQN